MRKTNPKPITNQSELAASLGLSRQLISAHAKKPGAPPLSDRAGWIEFLATVGRDGSAPVDIRRAIAQKRLEILEQHRIAAVRDNQKAAGEMMLTADAERQAAECMALTFAEWERWCRELPPAMAGLDAVAIFKRMTASMESGRKALKKKFEEVGK